jgi:hypothetical protein
LEKFVNLNFTGFHKILKKHDRRLPNPCKNFYISRLHDQSWVRGDHSDIMVVMSRVYSALRGDVAVNEKESARQVFHDSIIYFVTVIANCLYIYFQEFRAVNEEVLGSHREYLLSQVLHSSAPAGIPPEDNGRRDRLTAGQLCVLGQPCHGAVSRPLGQDAWSHRPSLPMVRK